MRRILLTTALLMGGWTRAGMLRAGVYDLDPPRKYPGDYAQVNALDPIWRVLMHLGELRAVHDAAKLASKVDTLRAAYETQLAKLEKQQREGTLTAGDRVNIGACLIRMGRYPQARAVLEESLRVVPPDSSAYCLLLLNLAGAYQEEDALLQRAIDLQTQALRIWPRLLPGGNRAESDWYRHAERYALTVMRLRQREQIRTQGRSASELPPLDELFAKVRFVGPGGQYEAGGIAFEQRELLPADAEKVVLQLLLWRPLDPRLNWLYGELLNVRGQVDWAFTVLDFCKQLASNRELRQHHQILREAVPIYRELFTDSTGSGEDRRRRALVLWSLSPRGTLLASAIGAAASEIGGVTAFTDFSILSGEPQPQPSRTSETQRAEAPRSDTALPEWRPLTVGFFTGVVVAVLGVLQWQQWQRHRRAAATLPNRGAEHFAPK